MGEYANYGRSKIKIGTCEDLYYLRYDQRHQVTALPGNVDATNAQHQEHLRFRFPFPFEDSTEPGAFENYHLGYTVPGGYRLPDDYEKHGRVQFTASAGYNTCLPCPESKAGRDFQEHTRIHRNGFPGAVAVVMQKKVDGELRTIVRCNGCHAMWQLPHEEAIKVAEAFTNEAEQLKDRDITRAQYAAKIAARILAGYHEKNSQPAAEAAQ